MDTWLNRDQQRQHRLEETDRGNSLEVFSAQKLPATATATDTASATGTRNGTEKGGERERAGQARQFVVRRPVLQRRLLRQPLFLAVLPCLPLSGVVCCRVGLGWCRCWWDDAASAAVAAGRLHCGATAWPKLARLHTNRALKPQRAD